MNVNEGIAMRKSITSYDFDVTSFYSKKDDLPNKKKELRRPNFLERWRQERRIRAYEASEMNLSETRSHTDFTTNPLNQSNQNLITQIQRRGSFADLPPSKAKTANISPVKHSQSSNPMYSNNNNTNNREPRMSSQPSNRPLRLPRNRSDIDESGLLRVQKRKLVTQLSEACEIIRIERMKLQEVRDRYLELEDIAKKLKARAEDEKRRADRLEEELIQRSNRKGSSQQVQRLKENLEIVLGKYKKLKMRFNERDVNGGNMRNGSLNSAVKDLEIYKSGLQ